MVADPDSTVAFTLYNSATAPTGGHVLLPAYIPSATAGQPGTMKYVSLSGTTALAPIAGIFSPDDTIFFVGTSGDSLVHYVSPSTLTDIQTINPGLTDASGKPVPVQLMAVKPRPTT